MRMSKLFFQTLREVPADAEIISHQLMLRAGLMRQLAAGLFDFMPIGMRIKRKIEEIFRQEMDAHLITFDSLLEVYLFLYPLKRLPILCFEYLNSLFFLQPLSKIEKALQEQ